MTITLKPLREQVMVVTGASSGIGLATARAAAARGARVMLVARNGEVLRTLVDEIVAQGGEAAWAVADVGDADAVRRAAEEAVARFGRIDTWVNAAGVAIFAKLRDTPLEEHERMFRTNYFGTVNGCQAALSHLARGGALITVASIASDMPSPVMGAYAATKHAVKAYLEVLRAELRADGVPVAVTIIKPAGIDTPIGQHAANHMAEGEPRVPPPLYAPRLVADAILAAAEHVRRDITVGGSGRLQVLAYQHVPRLLDLIAPLMIRFAVDRTKPRAPADTLFASTDAGRERRGGKHALRVSPYTRAALHPAAAAGVAAALAIAGVALWRRRKRAG